MDVQNKKFTILSIEEEEDIIEDASSNLYSSNHGASCLSGVGGLREMGSSRQY